MEKDTEQKLNEDLELTEEIVSEEIADEETEEVVDEAQKKLEELEQQAKDNFDKYLRQVAEFDNFRKRTNIEKASMYSNGVRDAVERLLPVIDNFERAVDTATDKEDSFYKGVEMILKQFLEILSSLGVEEIPALGESFDPNVHSAVMHSEEEGYDENVISEVFQKGYKLGDKVIRPSMVKVVN